MKPGKGAVTFTLPPQERPTKSRPIRQSSKTSYILTPAQLALMAVAANSAPVEDTVAGGMQHDIPQGEPCSLMQPQPLAEAHPFTPTLKEWRRGIKVDCGPDWSWSDIEAAVARGLHPTARTPAAVALFADDIAYQVKAGFCSVMSWEDVKRLRPTNLKISPVALLPQVGRRGRIIPTGLHILFSKLDISDGF